MKYLFFILFAFLSVFANAQTTANLTPEATWADDNHRDWCDHGTGTAFLGYNGVLYAFNYQGNGTRNGGHAYMYTVNKGNLTDLTNVNLEDYKVGPSADHDNRIEFKFPGENTSYDEGAVLGRAFTFTYNSTAWFFMHIRSADQGEHESSPANESYECFAELPGDDSRKCFTYFKTTSPVSTVLKQGAFQIDSLMYFLAYDKTKSPYHWVVQEYNYNTDSGQFSKTQDIIPSDWNNQWGYLGGVLKKADSVGNEYVVVSLYDQLGRVTLGKLIPHVSNGKMTFKWTSLIGTVSSPFSKSTGASSLVQGSIKGHRGASDIANKASSDRVILFGESLSQYSDGFYHIWYIEYSVEKELFVKQCEGDVTLPGSNGPHLVSGNYHLYSSFQLFPKDYTTYMSGVDGFLQYLWVIYPDQNRHFHGLMFESDKWRLDPGENVESADLWNDDTIHSGYKGISSLWNLVAILDGPPPVEMDWEKWNSIYTDPPTPPTEISLFNSKLEKTEFMNSTEHEWSFGETLELTKVKGSKYKGNSEEFKYSGAWESATTTSTEKTVSYDQPIGLFDENQDYGCYLYIVPEMKRYSYSLYPWWDDNYLRYPVPGSFQYCFITNNVATSLINKPLSSFPFQIAEPNGTGLTSWERSSRPQLDAAIRTYDLNPCMSLSWNDGRDGSSGEIEYVEDTLTTTTVSNSWDFSLTAGAATVTIPKVCEIELYLSVGYGGKLVNETSTTTQHTQRISASLRNLSFASEGIRVNHLYVDAYMFTPGAVHWWYLDSTKGQTPWYLAWVVTKATQYLRNTSPLNDSKFDSSGAIFSWQPDLGELYNYELFISKKPHVDGLGAIYRKKIGNKTETSVTDFKPESGVSYYWSVRGFDENGEMVWSPAWKLSTPKDEEEATVLPAIKTVIYPNPGKKSEMRFIVDPEKDGVVTVSLVNLSGVEIARREFPGTSGVTAVIDFANVDLQAGLYFAVIRSGDGKVVKKVIVTGNF